MDFENTVQIGIGAYTPQDIARILRVKAGKVRRWIHTYWDEKLGEEYAQQYSWKTDGSRAVSFHTLIEFYVMMQLSDAGVMPGKVIKAHKDLSELFNTLFPLARKEVLQGIKTDAKQIFFEVNEQIISLDGSRQLNLDFIRLFYQKLDFDDHQLAERFWPMGKEKSVVIDPKRMFGHPVVNDTNIYPETLYNHKKAGDPIPYIAYIYNLSESQVKHAIAFCEAA